MRLSTGNVFMDKMESDARFGRQRSSAFRTHRGSTRRPQEKIRKAGFWTAFPGPALPWAALLKNTVLLFSLFFFLFCSVFPSEGANPNQFQVYEGYQQPQTLGGWSVGGGGGGEVPPLLSPRKSKTSPKNPN